MAMASTSSPAHADPAATLRLAAIRRRREAVSWAALALFIIVVVIAQFAVLGFRHEPLPALLAALGAAFVQSVFSTRNGRCPACDKHIRGGIRAAHFCPQCGVRLQSSEGGDA